MADAPPTSMTDTTLAIGSTFVDRYEILAELGAGSFGRVYQARQASTGQLVAIKVLRVRPGSDRGDRQIERFRRETRLCAALAHPNIVRLIDAGECADGVLYAAFEFIPGSTLKDVIAREGGLEWNETMHLMSQVLDALACAHEHGVVHRDLKPENIMVTSAGARRNALVLDFGLGGFTESRAAEDARLTATQEMMGTPCYAAPEQLRGETPTPRSDLYSWGLVLLECLTGEVVVSGSSTQQVLLRQLGSETIPVPASIRDPALRRVLPRVIHKNVENRDASVPELLGVLSHSRGAEAIGEPASPKEPERRRLTVLCNVTTLKRTDGSAADPEELDDALRALHAVWARLASRRGGTPADTIGQAGFAVFGYPQAHEDDAVRATQTALAFVDAVERMAGQWRAERALHVEVGVGVHTDVTVVRPARRVGIDVCELAGPTVQRALELAERAHGGETLVSDAARRRLRIGYDFEPAGELPSRTTCGSLAVHRLLRDARPGAPADTLLPGTESPLVGRRTQVGTLRALWNDARAAKNAAALLVGEPGIGKSRLLRELRRELPSNAWIELRCNAESQSSPLRPVIDHLASLNIGVPALVERFGVATKEAEDVLTALLVPTAVTLPHLTRERQKELTLDALTQLLLGVGRERPVVVAFEDVHWADETTLELATLLVDSLDATRGDDRPSRLGIVFSARPEFRAPWSIERVPIMYLPRLTAPEVEEMVQGSLEKSQAFTPEILESLVRKADGIPLFVEEVTRVLVESASSEADADFHVPATLWDLLASRLDALSESARETAQVAAVMGREIRGELLRVLSRKDAAILADDLAELARAGILYNRRSVRDQTYVFKHALVRDAAYDSLLRAPRQRLHHHVAVTLQGRFPDVERTRPDLMAFHFERANEIATAADYWKRAGDQAMARGSYVEAIRLLEHGLASLRRLADLPDHRLRELALTESLGTALFTTRGYGAPEVETTFARAQSLCDSVGADVPVRVLYGLWAVHVARADAEATRKLLPRFMSLAERTHDPVAMGIAYGVTGTRAFIAGEFTDCCRAMHESIRCYDSTGYQAFVREYGYDLAVYGYGYLGGSLWCLGRLAEAGTVTNEMLALAEGSANPYALTVALSFAANRAVDRRDPELACDLSARGIAIATEQRLYFWLGPLSCAQGWTLARAGRIDEGLAAMRQGLSIFAATGVRATSRYCLTFLLDTLLARGAVEEGLELLAQDAASGPTLEHFCDADLLRLQGEFLRLRGDLDAARDAFARALEVARGQQARLFELRTATSVAGLAGSGGPGVEARRALAAIVDEHFAGLERFEDVRSARRVLAEVS